MTNDYWNPKIETMPLNELKDLQLKRLKKLIDYIYNNNNILYLESLCAIRICVCVLCAKI